jgi:hypothetical protein
MNRDDIRQLADRLGYPFVSMNFIERVEERLNCHYGSIDPMATFAIQSSYIEEELKALRGDIRREAEAAAKTGAAEGAKAGAAEGAKAGTSDLTSSIVNLSAHLQEWLDKGYVSLAANTNLLRELQDRMEKGKGVTLKVDKVALSPQTRRELLAAIPEATVRAISAEYQRPLRRANTVIFGLTLFVFFLLTMMMNQASRPTEQIVHWAANDVSEQADNVIEQLMVDRKLDTRSAFVPRNVAVTGGKLMTERVAELSLGKVESGLASEHRSWTAYFLDWAAKCQLETGVFAAIALLVGFLCGKGWR